MNILSTTIFTKQYNNVNVKQQLGNQATTITKEHSQNHYTPSFQAASDITLRYLADKRAKYLPKRVFNEINELITTGKDNGVTIIDLHNKVYAELFNAKSLEEVKSLYPEFKDVIDAQTIEGNRSKAVTAIKNKMNLKDFSLKIIQDLYSLKTEDSLVKEFGLTNRSLLLWVLEKLNIPKLSGNYNILVKMSNEVENKRIAELSRQAIFNNPEEQARKLKLAGESQSRPEVAEKKRIAMKKHYAENPEHAKKTSIISKRTWDKCPEIKQALSEFTAKEPDVFRRLLSLRTKGKVLNSDEKRILSGYYKCFWEQYPELLVKYKQARLDVINEMRAEGLL